MNLAKKFHGVKVFWGADHCLAPWLALKRTKRANNDQLRILFERLGFEVLSLTESSGRPRAWIALQVKRLVSLDTLYYDYRGQVLEPEQMRGPARAEN
jgi:hypothetical protein